LKYPFLFKYFNLVVNSLDRSRPGPSSLLARLEITNAHDHMSPLVKLIKGTVARDFRVLTDLLGPLAQGDHPTTELMAGRDHGFHVSRNIGSVP
jgi:hypothetical protein